MNRQQQFRFFLFGQHLADGVRVTLAIVLPALIGSFSGFFYEGVTMSVGALCLSISDAPGPWKYKQNGLLFCLLFVGIMSLVTGLLNHYPFWMGVLIAVSTFFFSMFNVFGSRAASVGTGALMIMILRMADVLTPEEVVRETLLVVAGGTWYTLASLAFTIIRPFRPIQRALGDCINETAQYLLIKTGVYDARKDIDQVYSELTRQQSVVNEKQDTTRELLFKNRSVLKESTFEGRRLVVTFAATVDLFEQMMAAWFDFEGLRKRHGNDSITERIRELMLLLADELNRIGDALHSHSDYVKGPSLAGNPDLIKEKADRLLQEHPGREIEEILNHAVKLDKQVKNIAHYFSGSKKTVETNFSKKDYKRFVPHQKVSGALFVDNMSLNSTAFRHSLRVMITCVAGFILGQTFFRGDHSYWILMTIIIILKPGYSLTKSKNVDRLSGTIAGGIIGLLLLNLIHNDYALFGLLVFFALGTYTFVRLNYAVMVIFLTPYVLILFHFLGRNIVNAAGERLLDTFIASILAWLAVMFLFPSWESGVIKDSLKAVLKANIKYLEMLRNAFIKGSLPSVGYRLVRKEVFVSSANLSSALHRMQSEPKSKQKHRVELYELVVLNHVLSSNIAALLNTVATEVKETSDANIAKLNGGLSNLEATVRVIDPAFRYDYISDSETVKNTTSPTGENLSEESFNFIEKVTADIKRVGNKLTEN